MKSMSKVIGVVFAVLLFGSCSVHKNAGKSATAPGQVKKITGAKSAKAYAPGQRKKNGND
ncbi:hypothetical protein [Flagellimonas crocea]|uniref:hypothetical protein n=1 Tax=Flagellimonas crocea TaxID=3067311 RepID=UPI00296FEDE3|nr:hypothetical protein [Muricauda sp. DH64]